MFKKKRNLIFLTILSLCVLIFYKYLDIALVNRHIDIAGLKLLYTLEKFKRELPEGFKFKPGWFGAEAYINEKESIEVFFCGFPDLTSRHVITGIETTNSKHSFYDISVGDHVDNAVRALKNAQYKLVQKTNNCFSFSRNRISIGLYFDNDDKINRIKIGLHSTNIFKVIF